MVDRGGWFALGGRAAIDGAGADGDETLQFLRNSLSGHGRFSALHRPPSMMPRSQSGADLLMSVNGESGQPRCSRAGVEQALVDVEKGHVTTETAGQRGGGDLVFLPGASVSGSLLGDGFGDGRLVVRCARRWAGSKPVRFLGITPPANLNGLVAEGDVGISQAAGLALTMKVGLMPRPERAKTFLPSTIPAGPHCTTNRGCSG